MSVRTFCIAPMMDHTDRHFRYLMRLLAPHAWLFTEMIPAGAVLHGNASKFLDFNEEEHPVSLQLGGSEPGDLARCAAMAQEQGYDEVNLNVGCPSGRVSAGRFGACLMKEPERVAECVSAMQARTDIPVSVKCRIGVDRQDSAEDLHRFVATVAEAGCQIFYVHARKAMLSGLSPKQNRTIPPLNYERVWELKREFPQLTVVVNGGIRAVDEVYRQLAHMDGVMIGRLAYEDPWTVRRMENELFSASNIPATPSEVLEAYLPYLERERLRGVPLARMTRHISGLLHGRPGARNWRRVATRPEPEDAALNALRDMAGQAVAA